MISIKRAAFGFWAGASLLTLSACSNEAGAPQSDAEAGTTQGNLAISNARLVLAPVAGNPAAVYFDLSYTGEGNLTVSSIAVEGAGHTMIHDYGESAGVMKMMEAQPIALTKGANVTFAPGGLHVMAMQPSDVWKPGDMVNVTLTLSDGTSQSFAAEVRSAGEER